MLWIAAAIAALVLLGAATRHSEASRKSSAGWLVAIVAALLLLGSLRFGVRALLFAGLPAAWLAWSVLRKPASASGSDFAQGQRSGAMTHEEALRVLGLEAGASAAEIAAAHRALIKKLHPDQGGSGFLAQQVNEAKDVLLQR